jgi:hypothetical protein
MDRLYREEVLRAGAAWPEEKRIPRPARWRWK